MTAVKKGLGFDESVLESLEEALLEADVGAETAGCADERGPRRGRAPPSARISQGCAGS